jgi:DNA-binding Xre family transcriptional regulator
MPIIVNLDAMLARRKIKPETASKPANLVTLKNAR